MGGGKINEPSIAAEILNHFWSLEEFGSLLDCKSMTKYEYKTIRVDYSVSADKAACSLDDLGQDGWDLVTILPETSKAGIAFLKRPLEK
jgi:hypothetical protein